MQIISITCCIKTCNLKQVNVWEDTHTKYVSYLSCHDFVHEFNHLINIPLVTNNVFLNFSSFLHWAIDLACPGMESVISYVRGQRYIFLQSKFKCDWLMLQKYILPFFPSSTSCNNLIIDCFYMALKLSVEHYFDQGMVAGHCIRWSKDLSFFLVLHLLWEYFLHFNAKRGEKGKKYNTA